MSGHTPGPWKAAPNGCGKCAVRTEDGVWLTYKAGSDHAPTETLEANARLIAAAPELLEAVKAMIEWDDREQDHLVDFNARMDLCKRAFDLARAAIAKATGEGE